MNDKNISNRAVMADGSYFPNFKVALDSFSGKPISARQHLKYRNAFDEFGEVEIQGVLFSEVPASEEGLLSYYEDRVSYMFAGY